MHHEQDVTKDVTKRCYIRCNKRPIFKRVWIPISTRLSIPRSKNPICPIAGKRIDGLALLSSGLVQREVQIATFRVWNSKSPVPFPTTITVLPNRGEGKLGIQTSCIPLKNWPYVKYWSWQRGWVNIYIL